MRQIAWLATVVLLVGCGNVAPGTSAKSYEPTAAESTVAYDMDFDGAYGGAMDRFGVPAVPPLEEAATEAIPVAAQAPSATTGRKIVYNADVQMVVKDLNEFLTAIRQAIDEHGGFIGSSTESGRNGSNPTASITVRVPAAGYQPLLMELDKLGTVDERSETSRDVTAEFVDVEARIRNKEREEQRLLELLAEAEGKLKEILEVERELSRVRGEVERAQGQMNVLKDQIGLATITIRATERTVYAPPSPAGFGDRISAAWGNSLTNLQQFFSRATIEVVAFVPWLVVWIPLGIVAWFVGSRVSRKIKTLAWRLATVLPIRTGKNSSPS